MLWDIEETADWRSLLQYRKQKYSSNGTRFVDGGVAKAGIYSTVPEGTVLIMGGIERIRLGG